MHVYVYVCLRTKDWKELDQIVVSLSGRILMLFKMFFISFYILSLLSNYIYCITLTVNVLMLFFE